MNSKVKFCMLFLCSMFILCTHVNAQTGTKSISGVVLESNREPAVGASIVIKGTNTGTIADFDGKFKLDVPLYGGGGGDPYNLLYWPYYAGNRDK